MPMQRKEFSVNGFNFAIEAAVNKRWSRFRTDRRVYHVNYLGYDGQASDKDHYLLNMSMTSTLGELMEEILRMVREDHETQGRPEDALISISLNAEGLEYPVNSSIAGLDNPRVAEDVLSKLSLSLISKKSLSLKKGFQIHVTIVDGGKPSDFYTAGASDLKVWKSALAMSWDKKDMFKKGTVLFMPLMTDIYHNCCLLLAVVTSLVKAENVKSLNMGRGKTREWKNIRAMNDESDWARNRAISQLGKITDRIVRDKHLDIEVFRCSSLDERLKAEIDKLGVNLVVLQDDYSYKPVFYHPLFADPRKPFLIVIRIASGSEAGYHAGSLINPHGLLKSGYKKWCMFCHRSFKKVGQRHKCRTKNSLDMCKLCGRVVFKEDFYLCDNLSSTYCIRKPNSTHVCPVCERKCYGKTCVNIHKVKHQNSKGLGKLRYCRVCKDNASTERDHVCKMAKPKMQTKRDLLAIFDTETRVHQDRHFVNAVGLSFQTKRGGFHEVCFYDEDLNHPEDCRLRKDAIVGLGQDEILIDFADRVKKIKQEGGTALEKYLNFILNEDFRGFTFIAHASSRFDSILLLRSLLDRREELEPIFDGNKAILIKLPNRKIRFIDSYKYIPSPLSNFHKRFPSLEKESNSKGTFPHGMNIPEYYEYEGEFPEDDYFLESQRIKKDFEEDKRIAKIQAGRPWNFKREFHRYLLQDVRVLRGGVLCLVREFEQFQNQLKIENGMTDVDEVFHPFSPPFFTRGSFVHSLWQFYEMKEDEIRLVKNQRNGRNTSMKEIQWLNYLISKGHTIRTQFNHKDGQRRVGRYFADGVEELEGGKLRVFEFLGCEVHYHAGENIHCPKTRRLQPTDRAPFDSSCAAAYAKTEKKLQALRDYGHEVVTKWECEFDRDAVEDAELSRHLTKMRNERAPTERLRIRSGLRGGRCESFRLAYTKEKISDRNLFYIDKNSLYPAVAIFNDFPIGFPEYVIGEQIRRLTRQNGFFELDGRKAIGLLQVSIEAPDSIYVPLLPVFREGKMRFGLCSACLDEDNKAFCKHSSSERMFTDIWTTAEILFALECGYRLVKIWEGFLYTRQRPIFKNFYTLLAKTKLKSEGFPGHVRTPKEKAKYVEKLNTHMHGLNLKAEEVESNRPLRDFAKLVSNAGLGKFSQNDKRSNSTLVYSFQSLIELLHFSPHLEVKRLNPIDDLCMEVGHEPRDNLMGYHKNTQCVIYSFVTAYARIGMMKDMRELMKLGARIYYTDTDSIIFDYPDDRSMDELERRFHMGSKAYNAYKYETDKAIVSYASLGSKNYSFVTSDGGMVIKTRGFTLTGRESRKFINHDAMKEMVSYFAQGRKKEIVLNTDRINIVNKTKLVNSKVGKKYSNHVFDKRFLPDPKILREHDDPDQEASCLSTWPYGLKNAQFADAPNESLKTEL